MEAVPRLPMIHFEMKTSPEPTSFKSLKQFIAKYYQEDPASYWRECHQLESLRGNAVRPSEDMYGCSVMKRYYCQLHSIQSRFLLSNLTESQQTLSFHWRDLYSGATVEKTNLKFEMAAVLHNIGSMHTQLGAAEARDNPESMKKACTHFQCAAWAYGHIKDNFALVLQGDLSTELLMFMQHLCFAQAQECIMEKSLCDNRKSGIIAKVTAQIISYYNSALAALLTQTGEDARIQDIIGSKLFKEWRRYVKFKISYLSCILLLYQGQQSEELQKMGERVTLYQASFDKLEEARKESKGMTNIEVVNEALQFTMDVVEAKRKAAKNENEFIYHEDVPELTSISAVQGANLVNGISFSVTDPEVFGYDIFNRLVPMKAHESSSMYSEEKATLLRTIGTKVEDKNSELNTFMSSLNLDTINLNNPNSFNDTRLPQGLVDRCAAINAKPNAIPDLVQSMSNLADTCSEVETMLNEIKNLLRQDEIQEESYQQKIGQRSNGGGHIVELNREFVKYLEAHNKAGESNETLRKAMGLHVHNLKILAQPLTEIQQQIPTCGDQINEPTIKELQNILNKVNEMQQQRVQLYQDLRENVTNDDITSQLIAIEGGEEKSKMEELFKRELAKHDKLVMLTEQNLKAQVNILKALTDIYARCAPMIKSISDTKSRKDQFFSSLQGSYDVYEDLLSKSAKGLEFYKKLQGNVQKLLSRVKAACDVQDEERNQKLKSSSIKRQEVVETKSSGPKLKDYLKSGNYPKSKSNVNDSTYVPTIRPNPLGSESTASSSVSSSMNQYQDSYTNYSNYYSANSGHVPAANTNSVSSNVMPPEYQQFYQHPQQQIPEAAAAATTIAAPQTGYVNPIYQNSTYFYNQPQPVMEQYPQPQPSPALSSVSSDASLQQWSQMNQQFVNMNLQQPAYSVPVEQVPPQPQQQHHPQQQQQQQQQHPQQQQQQYYQQDYTPQTLTSSNSQQGISQMDQMTYSNQYYGQYQQNVQPPPPYQEQAPPNHTAQPQYFQPQQQQYQSPPPQYQEQASSYASHPGYSFNQQTGIYDYGSGYQADSTTNQYTNVNANQFREASVPVNIGSNTMNTDSATYANQYITSPTYDMSQQYQQPQQQYQAAPEQHNQSMSSSFYTAPYGSQSSVSLSTNVSHSQVADNACINSNNFTNNTTTTNSSGNGTSNVSASLYPVTPVPTQIVKPKPATPKRSSNIDLLSGIDFTPSAVNIETPTLQPQPILKPDDDIKSEILVPTKAMSVISSIPPVVPPISAPITIVDRKMSADNLSVCSDLSSIDQNFDWESASLKAEDTNAVNRNSENILLKYNKDPFEDQKVLKWFHKEVERLEKFIESLNVKTLNGTTPLDSKWKELQDMLVKDESKRQVSVARLFPEKNRSIDSIPYDHARVSLPTTTDNYINAVYVKDLGSGCPTLILAQTPLQNTVNDFWNMTWSQKSNVVVCLHTPNEILDTFWPQEINQELTYGDVSVTLLKQFDLTNCIERTLKVTMHGSDFILNVSLLQAKLWPKNSAEYVLGIAQNIISTYKQQNQGEKQMKTLIMNCLNGADRSGLVTLAIATILATQTKRPILINVIDVWYRICCQRKGALRDTNSIQFSYQIVLNNGYSILNKRGIMTSYQMKNVQTTATAEKEEAINDPFKDLDPLWKLK